MALQLTGLRYIDNFISAEAECELIAKIDSMLWLEDLKRRVQHYGYKYDYRARRIDSSMYLGELPDWLVAIDEKIRQAQAELPRFDQVIVNEYKPGQGISAHVDCVSCFEDGIAIISLGSSCVIEFSNETDIYKFLLRPRSQLLLTKDSRFFWKHQIRARKTDNWEGHVLKRQRRLSLTFRKVIL